MKPTCGKTHPNLPHVVCSRIATKPGDHVGPCARTIILEWEFDERGLLKRSAVVNGRVKNLELHYGGPAIPDHLPTTVVAPLERHNAIDDLTPMPDDDKEKE